jgi:hypothetical protein
LKEVFEGTMEGLFGTVSISTLAAAVLVVAVAAAAAVGYLGFRLRRLNARYDALMRDARGKSLEEMVLERLDRKSVV